MSKRKIYLFIGCVAMLCGGVIYAWSILKTPFGDAFGWSRTGLAMNFTIMMCCFCAGGLISGAYLRRYSSVRVILFLAAVLALSGFWLTSRLSGNIVFLYLTYGCLGGLGIGLMYNAVITAVNAWYPDKKGFVTGLLMMCYSASAMVFGKIAGILMGEDRLGWRATYMLLGAVLGAVFLAAGLILRRPGEEDAAVHRIEQKENKDSALYQGEYTASMLVRSLAFWEFFVFTLTMAAVYNALVSFANDYVLSLGVDTGLALTLVGFLSVCNGVGRLVSGKVIDLFGCWKTMLFANTMTMIAPLLAIASILWDSVPIGVVALFTTGISGGFSPTLTSTFTGAAFGMQHFSINYGIANLVMVPASFMATFAAFLAQGDSFLWSFVMLFASAVVSLVMSRMLKKAVNKSANA